MEIYKFHRFLGGGAIMNAYPFLPSMVPILNWPCVVISEKLQNTLDSF